MNAPPVLQRQIRIAARALGRHGLAHAYGHCSIRLDQGHFLVCAARPMGLIGVEELGIVVPVEGPLPDGVLGEVRLHQQVYQRRPGICAVARTMPPAVMALGTARRTPKPRHGMGAYFHAGVALWDDPQLVRDDARAAAVIDKLGDCSAVVMRGNGAVVVSESLQKTVALTWYLEDAARLELSVLSAGLGVDSEILSQDECVARATDAGGIFERMWEYLASGDPEFYLQDGQL